MNKITWSASNGNTFLNGEREAKTLLGAVRASRHYLENELSGEGKITVYSNGNPVRIDRKDMFTGYKWDTQTDFF